MSSSSNEKKKEEVEVDARPEVIANISYSQVARKKVSGKITFGILIVGIVASSFFLSGNKTRVPKKVNPLAGPNLDQSLSNQFDDDYKLAEEIEKANRPKKKVIKRRRKKVIFYERPKIIESKVIGQILPGSMIKAKLVMGGSDGFAKAVSLEPIKNQGEILIPAGSVFVGVAASQGSRLYLNFTTVVFPDSTVKKVKAIGADWKDKISGIKGSTFSSYGKRLAASSALNLLGGVSAGLRDQVVVQGVAVEANTLKNAALNGSAQAAVELSKEMMNGAKGTKVIVEVKKDTKFYLLF